MSGILDGIRVLDLSEGIAGPYCTKYLASLGAEVTKVESPPFGDHARAMGPFAQDDPKPDKSLLFLYLNTGKRGITLNLNTSTGQALFRRLLTWADVVVESFQPGVLARWSLDYAALEPTHHRLVMTSITPFGQEGPYRLYRGEDLVLYAASGVMYISGAYDREPIKHGLRQAQYLAGLSGAVGTMFALLHQQATGEGQHVDISMAETLSSELLTNQPYYAYAGMVQRRAPKGGSGIGGAVRMLRARDGYVAPTLGGSAATWDNMFALVGALELLDPKFETPELRQANISELEAVLEDAFKDRSKAEIFHAAQELRILFGMVQTPKDLAECPHLDARGFYVEASHPVAGSLRYPGLPIRFSEENWQMGSVAPRIGEHNAAVYGELLGYGRQDLVRLRERGVI